MEESKVVCAICGGLVDIDETTEIDGNAVCEHCRDEHYVQCHECGEWLSREDAVYFDFETYHECCLDDITMICENCGERHYNDDCYTVFDRHRNPQTWCQGCVDYDAHYCDGCGNYFSCDLSYDEENDTLYCDRCAPANDKIKSYHEHHGCEMYYTAKGRVPLTTFAKYGGLGIELEVEKRGSSFKERNEIAEQVEKILGEGRVVFETDGSLTDGFEIITSPHTLRAFKKLDFKSVLETLSKLDCRSHDGGNCGLHIHFSKSLLGEKFYSLNLAKLIYFYHKHYDAFFKISRREINSADRWAGKIYPVTEIIENHTPRKAIQLIQERIVANSWRDRYLCINLRNTATIEFRMGRGTLKYETFKNWIDLHMALMINVHKVSIDNLDNLDLWLKDVDENIVDVFRNN